MPIRFCLSISICVISYLLCIRTYADGFWTVEISEEDFVLVSIEDADYRGTWLLEIGFPQSILNGSSTTDRKDSFQDERFRISASNGNSDVVPFFTNRRRIPVDKMRTTDLSSLESDIGIAVRGILGRDALIDLRIQFLEQENKSILQLSEVDDSRFERERMSDPISLNFENGGMMTGIFNIGSNILPCKIATTGGMDFNLSIDVIKLLGNGRKSRQPFSMLTEVSSKKSISPHARPNQGWYFDQIFFEGSKLAGVRVLEDSHSAIHLGALLRRNACFVMSENPVLYLSKSENNNRTPRSLSEIQVKRVQGNYLVTSVRKDGRFNEVLNIGDIIISLDGMPVDNLTALQIRRKCAESLERGALIGINRNGNVTQISTIIPHQSYEQMVESLFEASDNK